MFQFNERLRACGKKENWFVFASKKCLKVKYFNVGIYQHSSFHLVNPLTKSLTAVVVFH